MRQHENKGMKMASFYVSIGERDCALALMAKIEGDHDEAIEESKSAVYSTPNKEPEDERDVGKVDDINIEAPRPNNSGGVDDINIEAPRPNEDAGEGDDDNIEVLMQEEV